MLNRLPVLLGLTLAWCGCCASAPVGELHAQTPTKASRCYLLEIKGMTCEGCAAHVQKALLQVPSVAEAKVTYAKSGSVLLAGCTTKSEPQGEVAPQRDASPFVAAKGESSKPASPQRVTLLVEGMTKVQGIT